MNNFDAIAVQVAELSQEEKTLIYLMLAREFSDEGMSSIALNIPLKNGKRLQASAVVCCDITELEDEGDE